MTTVYDLPEEQKIYIIKLSNGDSFTVTGPEKETILKARQDFINLSNGEVIKKSFIMCIVLDKEATKDGYLRLNEGGKIALDNSIKRY